MRLFQQSSVLVASITFACLFSMGCKTTPDPREIAREQAHERALQNRQAELASLDPGKQVLLRVNSDNAADRHSTFYLSVVFHDHQFAGISFSRTSDRGEVLLLDDLNDWQSVVTRSKYGVSKDVVLLRIPSFNPENGGTLLVSGMRDYSIVRSDDYRLFEAQLTNSNGKWAVQAQIGNQWRPIDELALKTRVVDGKERGIESFCVGKDGKTINCVDTRDLPSSN